MAHKNATNKQGRETSINTLRQNPVSNSQPGTKKLVADLRRRPEGAIAPPP